LNNKGRYAFLGRDTNKRKSLIALLNNYILSINFKIFSSFVDKQKLALKYGSFADGELTKIGKIRPNIHACSTPRKINLYSVALKYLLLQYHEYLKENHKKGIIIAEARGEKEDLSLLDAFYQYQRVGVGSLSGKHLRTNIVDLLVIRKAQNHLGLQIADLVTYPLYDYKVPDHNVRNDHFISLTSFEKKIKSIKIFP